MDAAHRCLQHGQSTYDPQVLKLGQPELPVTRQGQPSTSISIPVEKILQVQRAEVVATVVQTPKHRNSKGKYISVSRVLPPGRVQELKAKRIPSKKQESSTIVPPLSAEDVAHSVTDDITTVMLRNVPLRYIPEELLQEFITAGFDGTFDFFYLPIDFRTKRNRGYCFVNFTSASHTKDFVRAFHGTHLERYSTKKILEVAPADTQGLEANTEKFMNQRVCNPWFRPMFFGDAVDAVDADDADNAFL